MPTKETPDLNHPACINCWDKMFNMVSKGYYCNVWGGRLEACSRRKGYDRGAGKEQIIKALGTTEGRWNVDSAALSRNGMTVVGEEYLEQLESEHAELSAALEAAQQELATLRDRIEHPPASFGL